MERHRHFCTLYQREVNTVGVAAIGFGKAYWHTFVALLFIITIRIKLNPIKPALIQMSIFIILFGLETRAISVPLITGRGFSGGLQQRVSL